MATKVVTREEWFAARKALLEKEKEITRAQDAVAAQLRELPMVEVDKRYRFHGPDGSTLLLEDLFGGKDQLIVYHFMFGPDAERGCKGCAFVGEHIPNLRHLGSRNTAFVAVSRGPFAKLDAWKKTVGWTFPWYSSEGSDFNYDFHATLDPAVLPVEYNFATAAELEAKGLKYNTAGEQPGLSVFVRRDGKVYHTYSAYSRGVERLLGTFHLLDMTPLGRQVGPAGPADFKLKYEYEEDA
ncbi:hypothetical protein C8A01DRAFT_35192 [Parachaetomium inaequale]|uniref:DUF899 domain-containing protein n=1 Tax=Parachaetomium inaequale TaxID=2588326 RepID=A0AAN6SSM4_9PEZI|nr:hypothetical protein C8A01DRAFT_35192 [Parachaetomium inaequale]